MAVSQSVSLGMQPLVGLMTRFHLLLSSDALSD